MIDLLGVKRGRDAPKKLIELPDRSSPAFELIGEPNDLELRIYQSRGSLGDIDWLRYRLSGVMKVV